MCATTLGDGELFHDLVVRIQLRRLDERFKALGCRGGGRSEGKASEGDAKLKAVQV